MDAFLWLLYGAALAAIGGWLLRFWRRSEDGRRRSYAADILKRYGMTPQFYLATVDEEDPELLKALDVFALTGYILTRTNGEAVGKLCPRVAKGSHLRLVVSNS
ncbi:MULTISPECIES: hypothetical protein [Achromobacter]|uniref:Uncharacterized protein n=1 Tax=Achromobacter marplatensis TaxID=470868 RepID=A0AA43B0T0_9BURK|nr:hypothetical protein [Achromobacter marplatensis]MDH2051303.1 hypothetical protein [Achromobacter marplatensis]